MTEANTPALTELADIKAPEIPPEALEAFQKVAEALKELAKAIAEALRPLIEWTVQTARKLWDAICRGLVPRKWWHIYKHTKKRRIRKKYEKRIRERVLAIMAGAET